MRCPACGQENADGARFCNRCGARLAGGGAGDRESRRTVTVLFCDVAGSTPLGERLDPETLRGVMASYFETARSELERHGGTVEKFIGDAVMAVFGMPRLHEDDALRAVRAADGLRIAMTELNEELDRRHGVRLEIRIGINTGEVVAGDPTTDQALVTGDAVNVAARLEQAARPGEILVGQATYRLVRDAVEVEPVQALKLKGKTEQVEAHRLLRVDPRAEGRARRFEAPLIGRERERDQLRGAYADGAAARRCSLFTLLGTAGVGKSRLVREFIADIGTEARVLRGRCLPYGEGITYWPIAEAVQSAARVEDEDDLDTARHKIRALVSGQPDGDNIGSRVAQALGLGSEAVAQEEIHWGLRRYFESLAMERPLILVVDDVQWGEGSLLDLIDHIADWSRDAPIFLLCMARPELLEVRPGWGGGKLNATTVLLEPLPATAAERLIDGLPGGNALGERLRVRITEAAEGNPLFVEEMIAMLIDDGRLEQESDGSWAARGDPAEVSVPPTIKALLAARLDRLAPEERAVVGRASVVGRVFDGSAVRELTPESERVGIADRLLALIRKELVRPDRPSVAGEDAYRFRHLLIRDAAYEALPKMERADLHERLARWLERVAGDRVDEYVEIIAHHFDQALEYRAELGRNEGGSPLALDALGYWVRAAAKSGSAGSHAEAARQLDRALAIHREAAPTDADPIIGRRELLERLGEARRSAGEPEIGAAALRAALASGEIAGTDEDRALVQDQIGRYLWDAGDAAGSRAAHAEAVRLAADGSAGTEARVLAGQARLEVVSGKHRDSVPVAREAVRLAREVGDRVIEGDALNTLGVAVGRLGQSAEAVAALEQSLAIATEQADAHGVIRAYNNLAIALEAAGRLDDALATELEGYAAARRLGLQRSMGAFIGTSAAISAVVEGRLQEAVRLTSEIIGDGVTGARAALAWTIRSSALLHLDDMAGAREAIAAAGAIAERANTARDIVDVRISKAEIATEEGRSQEALAAVREGFALVDGLSELGRGIEERSRWFQVALRVAADSVELAAARDDAEQLQTAREEGGRLLARLEAFRRDADREYPADRYHRVHLLCAEADAVRATGRSDPTLWRAAADAAATYRLRIYEAYAMWRLAETLHRAGADAAEVEAALTEARQPALRRASPRMARHVDELAAIRQG